MSDFVGLQKRLESNPDLREATSNSLKKSEDGNTAASTAKKPSLGRRLLGGGHQVFGVHQKVDFCHSFKNMSCLRFDEIDLKCRTIFV